MPELKVRWTWHPFFTPFVEGWSIFQCQFVFSLGICFVEKRIQRTWWARLARLTLEALTNEFATPTLAIFVSPSAPVQPLSSNQSPSIFKATISRRLPSRITKFGSPWVSGQFQCICFATANNGWSTAITGTDQICHLEIMAVVMKLLVSNVVVAAYLRGNLTTIPFHLLEACFSTAAGFTCSSHSISSCRAIYR